MTTPAAMFGGLVTELKWVVAAVVIAVLGIIEVVAGRPWTWVWIAGLPLLGATFHVSSCRDTTRAR